MLRYDFRGRENNKDEGFKGHQRPSVKLPVCSVAMTVDYNNNKKYTITWHHWPHWAVETKHTKKILSVLVAPSWSCKLGGSAPLSFTFAQRRNEQRHSERNSWDCPVGLFLQDRRNHTDQWRSRTESKWRFYSLVLRRVSSLHAAVGSSMPVTKAPGHWTHSLWRLPPKMLMTHRVFKPHITK